MLQSELPTSFSTWRAMSIGEVRLFENFSRTAAHPHSPSRRGSARCPPRSARAPSRHRRCRRRRERRGWRVDPPDRSVRDAERVQYMSDFPPRRRAGEAPAVARSRPNASGPGNGASTTHPARRSARHRAHTRGGVCFARCRRPERTEPRRVDRPASPRSARETQQTRQTRQTPRQKIRRTKRAGSRAYRRLPLCSRGEGSETSRKACLTRRVIRACGERRSSRETRVGYLVGEKLLARRRRRTVVRRRRCSPERSAASSDRSASARP